MILVFILNWIVFISHSLILGRQGHYYDAGLFLTEMKRHYKNQLFLVLHSNMRKTDLKIIISMFTLNEQMEKKCIK